MRVSMAVFMGTAQDRCKHSFFGGGEGGGGVIRDKIGINLLLRPLLWALKNRYI